MCNCVSWEGVSASKQKQQIICYDWVGGTRLAVLPSYAAACGVSHSVWARCVASRWRAHPTALHNFLLLRLLCRASGQRRLRSGRLSWRSFGRHARRRQRRPASSSHGLRPAGRLLSVPCMSAQPSMQGAICACRCKGQPFAAGCEYKHRRVRQAGQCPCQMCQPNKRFDSGVSTAAARTGVNFPSLFSAAALRC